MDSKNSIVSAKADANDEDVERFSTNLLGLDDFKEVVIPKDKPRNMTTDQRHESELFKDTMFSQMSSRDNTEPKSKSQKQPTPNEPIYYKEGFFPQDKVKD
jgi:hypothetical protein